MYADHSRRVEADPHAAEQLRAHCKLMQGVNAALERLLLHATPADFAVLSTALQEMRLELSERALSGVQDRLCTLERSARIGAEQAAALQQAVHDKMPLALGTDLMHGLRLVSRQLRAVSGPLREDAVRGGGWGLRVGEQM